MNESLRFDLSVWGRSVLRWDSRRLYLSLLTLLGAPQRSLVADYENERHSTGSEFPVSETPTPRLNRRGARRAPLSYPALYAAHLQ
jgi:hypothetical protein